MLWVSKTFLLFLTCCFCAGNLGQSPYGDSHIGTLSDKNLMKQLVNNLVVDIITADREASAFCRTNQDVVIRETYVNESYIVSFILPLTNSNQISVQTRHRVLYIEATNPSINFEYEYVVTLTNILNLRALTWTFNDGILCVSVPYNGKFGLIADVSCSEDINSKINYVPETKCTDTYSEANAGSKTTANGGAFGAKSEAVSVGSKSGANVGSGVIVGGSGIASGNTEVYSKTATTASRPYGGGGADATATAGANSKAIAATSVNAATYDNGPNSTSKARSVSKGSSYSDGVGSVATSASAAGALSKDSNGTKSTTGATGIASSYNVGGEKGVGASNTLTTSGSVSTGPDGISLSSSTSASNTVNVFGKKISSTVTTATAINKDGSSFSVKLTPKNNVTKSIIDVKL